MIESKCHLVGEISTKQSLEGEISNAIKYLEPITQEKSTIPTKEEQILKPDDGFTGLSKVTVGSIPEDYIIPEGSIEITENGNYDVKQKIEAVVNIPEKQFGTKVIKSNGVYKASDDNLDGYSEVEVATSGADLNDYFLMNADKSKGIAFVKRFPKEVYDYLSYKNDHSTAIYMTGFFQYCESLEEISYFKSNNYNAFDNCFYQCRKLKSIPVLDTSNCQNMNSMFYQCNALEEAPLLNTSKVTNTAQMFSSCSSLETIPQYDLRKATNTSNMFAFCYKLKTVPDLNCEKSTNMYNMFAYCSELTSVGEIDCSSCTAINGIFQNNTKITYLGGLKNIGAGYLATQSANNMNYRVDISKAVELTEQSVINVLLGLFDIATKGCKTQTCIVGPTNLAKLTSDAGKQALAQAQSYGWTIS
ncbi:MAG: BspA family leucine-rich repeat surface protein [Clostridia bacterium]|nr:BspA family leucine-rich repeat surface protein [Clostridia bacterium]